MKRIIKSHDSMNGSSIFQARSTARRFLIYRGQIIHAEKSRKIISQNHNFRHSVTLRIIWHNFLRSIWHNGEPSEQRESDLASFQDGA
jgi:hypothetical protein